MTNRADPDQLASSEANWSGSTLFAKTGHVVFSKRRVKNFFIISHKKRLSKAVLMSTCNIFFFFFFFFCRVIKNINHVSSVLILRIEVKTVLSLPYIFSVLSGLVGCASGWWSGCRFDPCQVSNILL